MGLGYVGLPLALEMVRAGCSVYGIDADAQKVRQLSAGVSYVTDMSPEKGAAFFQVNSAAFQPTCLFRPQPRFSYGVTGRPHSCGAGGRPPVPGRYTWEGRTPQENRIAV
ncbi:MAG: hypothetical protein AB1445_13015 [Bacillota bacterium]